MRGLARDIRSDLTGAIRPVSLKKEAGRTSPTIKINTPAGTDALAETISGCSVSVAEEAMRLKIFSRRVEWPK
jgi:hypothetical protein